jgi:hypothetical protein
MTGHNRRAVQKPDLRTESSCATFVIVHKSYNELTEGQSSSYRKIAFEVMLAHFLLKIVGLETSGARNRKRVNLILSDRKGSEREEKEWIGEG